MELDLCALRAPCTCGKKHTLSVQGIWLEAGALSRLPDLLLKHGWQRPAILCDSNTFDVAGKEAARRLPGSALVCLPAEKLHADERGVGLARSGLNGPDVLVAVGAGTIHDITRFLAKEKGLPFLSVPTAASVDGFVSTVAAMTWQGCKKTFPAVAPMYVLADNSIFSRAPLRLTISGVCDLLGKYTALADWEIAHLATGEPWCQTICNLERAALSRVEARLDLIRSGDPEACGELMYGLLLSGLAMQMIGSSRPASGAEHHLSHLWEMELINPHLDALHGEKVGVGLLLAVQKYHTCAEQLRCASPHASWGGLEMELLQRYISPQVLPGVLEENRPDPLAALFPFEHTAAQLPSLLAVLDRLPQQRELFEKMHRMGAKCAMEDLGLDSSLLELSLRLSPYVRNRLTFMRLLKLWQLN